MIIPGVSVCCLGRAKGHDLTVDETLLTQLQSELRRRGRTPVKLSHGGKLESIVGWLENPRLKGAKLLADMHLLRTSSLYQFTKELIAKFGAAIGCSASFTGETQTLSDGSKAARCSEGGLHSVDIVEQPACGNGGLFEAQFNGSLMQFEARPILQRAAKSTLAVSVRQAAELRNLRERVKKLRIRFDTLNDDDEQPQGHDGGSNIGEITASGAIEGAGSAVLIDGLLHGEGTIAERLAAVARSLKNPIASGIPKKALIGGVAGAVLTGAAGIAVDKLFAGRRRKQQQQQQQRGTGAVGVIPAQTQLAALTEEEKRDRATYRVQGYKYKVKSDELDKAASSYIKSAATGGLAGGLVGSFRGKGKIGAAIGALSGIGSIAGLRAALPPDQFGQHSPAEHQGERAVPLTAALIAAVAAHRKLKQIAGNAADRLGASLARRV